MLTNVKRKIRERGQAPGKNFATSTSTGACPCKFSYNYYMYSACLGCKFCYRKVEGAKYRTFSPHLLDVEKNWNKNLFTSPILISKYCDPLLSPNVTDKSIGAMTYILEMGGYVIFRSAKHDVPDEIYNLAIKYKDHFQYQAKVFCDDSKFGKIIKSEFVPGFSDIGDMVNTYNKFVDLGIDSSVFIYPLIIGINDKMLISIIERFSAKKVILNQLFSTEKFKLDLSIYGHNISSMLSERTRNYWTYDSGILLRRLTNQILYCLDNDVSISFCNNKVINKILGKENNCCQFESKVVKLFKDGK